MDSSKRPASSEETVKSSSDSKIYKTERISDEGSLTFSSDSKLNINSHRVIVQLPFAAKGSQTEVLDNINNVEPPYDKIIENNSVELPYNKTNEKDKPSLPCNEGKDDDTADVDLSNNDRQIKINMSNCTYHSIGEQSYNSYLMNILSLKSAQWDEYAKVKKVAVNNAIGDRIAALRKNNIHVSDDSSSGVEPLSSGSNHATVSEDIPSDYTPKGSTDTKVTEKDARNLNTKVNLSSIISSNKIDKATTASVSKVDEASSPKKGYHSPIPSTIRFDESTIQNTKQDESTSVQSLKVDHMSIINENKAESVLSTYNVEEVPTKGSNKDLRPCNVDQVFRRSSYKDLKPKTDQVSKTNSNKELKSTPSERTGDKKPSKSSIKSILSVKKSDSKIDTRKISKTELSLKKSDLTLVPSSKAVDRNFSKTSESKSLPSAKKSDSKTVDRNSSKTSTNISVLSSNRSNLTSDPSPKVDHSNYSSITDKSSALTSTKTDDTSYGSSNITDGTAIFSSNTNNVSTQNVIEEIPAPKEIIPKIKMMGFKFSIVPPHKKEEIAKEELAKEELVKAGDQPVEEEEYGVGVWKIIMIDDAISETPSEKNEDNNSIHKVQSQKYEEDFEACKIEEKDIVKQKEKEEELALYRHITNKQLSIDRSISTRSILHVRTHSKSRKFPMRKIKKFFKWSRQKLKIFIFDKIKTKW